MKTPGCEICWKRDQCAEAEEGKFCPQFASEEPAVEGEDPNDRWMRGEDAEF